jgi:hypothetical protein
MRRAVTARDSLSAVPRNTTVKIVIMASASP